MYSRRELKNSGLHFLAKFLNDVVEDANLDAFANPNSV
jgi:hypothetical protein